MSRLYYQNFASFGMALCLIAYPLSAAAVQQSVLDKLETLKEDLREENARLDADANCKAEFLNAIKQEPDQQRKQELRRQLQQYVESTHAEPLMRGKCPTVIPNSENFNASTASSAESSSN